MREINAFALPGGPMFVNRGMIEAASSEGEVAGVMAHEISHVLLRHGTAQASKATKYEIGQLLGAIGGAVVGGAVGSVIAQGTQFGLGAAFLRYGREYEKQADLMGAQIMSRAGYDAAEMANMFKTIEKQGGSNGPEWLSDHPNPGNRYEYILKEAETLKVANPIRNSQDFARVKDHLKTLPKAPTTEEATKNAKRGGTSSGAPRPTGQAEPPSTRYQSYSEGGIFTISVPSNWRELAGSNAVTFAPAGRVRRLQRPERVHARRRSRRIAAREPRSADGDRRVAGFAAAGQSAHDAGVRVPGHRGGWAAGASDQRGQCVRGHRSRGSRLDRDDPGAQRRPLLCDRRGAAG